jgi:hypothetical protein
MFSHAITMSALSGSTSFASQPYFLRLLDHLLRILKLPLFRFVTLLVNVTLITAAFRSRQHILRVARFLSWEVEGAGHGWRHFFRLMTVGQVLVYVFLLLPLQHYDVRWIVGCKEKRKRSSMIMGSSIVVLRLMSAQN